MTATFPTLGSETTTPTKPPSELLSSRWPQRAPQGPKQMQTSQVQESTIFQRESQGTMVSRKLAPFVWLSICVELAALSDKVQISFKRLRWALGLTRSLLCLSKKLLALSRSKKHSTIEAKIQLILWTDSNSLSQDPARISTHRVGQTYRVKSVARRGPHRDRRPGSMS